MQDEDLLNKDFPNLYHLRILESIVHVFFHKEKHTLKLAKWDTRALKERLVGFNGLIIYKIYIKDQN